MKRTFIISQFIVFFTFLGCQKSDHSILYVEGNGVKDIEGNFYSTVIIGDQEWMAENLKTDFFCNGDSIPSTGDSVQVLVYNSNPQNAAIYGKLYNFNAANEISGLCPCGWEVPTELDYARLIDYLGGYKDAMKKMKSTGNLTDGNGLWVKRNLQNLYEGNNLSGFNALPGGYAITNDFLTYKYAYQDTFTAFWALPISVNRPISYHIITPQIGKIKHPGPLVFDQLYYSVRCIKKNK